MVTPPRWLRNTAMRMPEPLLAVPVVVILREYGLIGHTPLWLLVTLVLIAGVIQQPEVQQRLIGNGSRRHLHLTVALQFGLIGAIIYLSGWGPLLTMVFAILATQCLRVFGSVAWRPMVIWMVIVIAAGQAGIALGWVYCHLPTQTMAQVAGLLGAQIGLMLIRALGISAEKIERAEAAVRSREERFRALVQDSSDVVSIVDRAGQTRYVSPAIEHLTGLRPDEFMAAEYQRWLHPDDHVDAARVFEQSLADPGGEHRVELRLWHANGDLRWMEVTLRNLLDNPAVDGLVATYRDVTERRAIQERLIHDANHDLLTGLSNRAAFLRGLEDSFISGEPARTPAVLFVDLDGFKQVNDTHGHQAGDALIIAVAAMLRRSVLGSDIVGRLGGDEFGIVLTGVSSPDHAVTVAKRILAEMDHPVTVGDQQLYARASIGIAVAEPGDTDADELLHHADIAMYGAKRRQTHNFQLYVDGMRDPAIDALALDDELRHAVGNGELRLHYQPIVALDGGDLIGFEALMRWQHPTRGLLPPSEFIPLAEQTGTISELGAWALEHASRQVLDWQQQVPAGRRLKLSVNLSPHQLERTDLVTEVLTILRRTGFHPDDLVLEVTETALVKDESAIPLLTALRAEGIRIALDDFGTGYSSLRYLTRLPVDILKIDRCFVAELNGTGSASAVAEAMVRLAQVLHLETVAEGIEDAAQLTELTLLGCQSGQGYHFARPLEAGAVDRLIAGSATRWPALDVPAPLVPAEGAYGSASLGAPG